MSTDTGPADLPFNGALCWEVSAPGQPSSYLFGSIHQMDSRHIALPLDELEQLLDATDALCVEVDVSGVPDPDTLLPTGAAEHDLDQLLGSARHARLREILTGSTSLAVSTPEAHTLPLSLLTLMVTVDGQLRSEFFTAGDLEIERHFIELARRRGLPVHPLESVEEQMTLLVAETSEEKQLDELKQAIDRHDDPAVPDMFERYAAQDLRLLPEEDFLDPQMVSRNRLMADRLAPLLRAHSLFAIIGAAHLPHGSGLLALLADRGFTVTPRPLEIAVSRRS